MNYWITLLTHSFVPVILRGICRSGAPWQRSTSWDCLVGSDHGGQSPGLVRGPRGSPQHGKWRTKSKVQSWDPVKSRRKWWNSHSWRRLEKVHLKASVDLDKSMPQQVQPEVSISGHGLIHCTAGTEILWSLDTATREQVHPWEVVVYRWGHAGAGARGRVHCWSKGIRIEDCSGYTFKLL